MVTSHYYGKICIHHHGNSFLSLLLSLSEPHTNGTALRKYVCNVCACLLAAIYRKCAFKYFPKIQRPCALSSYVHTCKSLVLAETHLARWVTLHNI